MRRSQADVAVTAAVALTAVIAATLGAPTAVMAVAGLALLGAPGYVWGTVLVGGQAGALERVAVAATLSLAVPVLGGLALYAAGVPLARVAWAGLLGGVTLAGDVALLALRRAGRAQPCAWRLARPAIPARHAAIFAAAVLIAAGGVGLAGLGAARQHRPGFTQLWVVARNGTPPTADLGVSNHEPGTTRYRLVLLRTRRPALGWDITLTTGQSWQRLERFDGSRSITADLYRLPDLTHPYRHVFTTGTGVP